MHLRGFHTRFTGVSTDSLTVASDSFSSKCSCLCRIDDTDDGREVSDRRIGVDNAEGNQLGPHEADVSSEQQCE